MSKTTKKSVSIKGVTPAVKKYVKKAVKADSKKKDEVKYHTTVSTGYKNTPSLTGHLQKLTEVAQTAGAANDTTRIGDSIFMKALELRALVKTEGNDPVASRVIIFQWHIDDNVTVPAVSDVLSTGFLANQDSQSPYNHDSIKGNKLTILYDKTFTVMLNADSAMHSIYKKVDLKYAKKKIQYVSGTVKGMHNIYLLAIGSDANVAGITDVAIGFAARLFFIDP